MASLSWSEFGTAQPQLVLLFFGLGLDILCPVVNYIHKIFWPRGGTKWSSVIALFNLVLFFYSFYFFFVCFEILYLLSRSLIIEGTG